MLLAILSLGAALALEGAPVCQETPQHYLERVVQAGEREAYMCLAQRDEDGPFLLAEAQKKGAPNAVTRALAVHWMQRLDQEIPDDVARALSADDRRLLQDAIHARRGRKSPVEEHDAIVRQFDWYKPHEGFTKADLSGRDRDNIALLDAPPKAPKEEKPSAAQAIAEASATPANARSCGCGNGGAAFLVLPALLGLRRRRRG